jgi:hypothetical protein
LRLLIPALLLCSALPCLQAQQASSLQTALPDAPSQTLAPAREAQASRQQAQLDALSEPYRADDPALAQTPSGAPFQLALATPADVSSSLAPTALYDYTIAPAGHQQQDPAQAARQSDQGKKKKDSLLGPEFDENGKPIPLSRRQPKRLLGFMPNYRTVSAGAAVHPPGWAYNFHVATHQAFDYSTFIFLGLTSLTAEGLDSHPVLGKGVHGFYSYTWRGLIDKTDGTYLSAFLLPSLLHEDTRYYPLGDGHSVLIRSLYVISRQGVARTYGGRQTPNIAGLGGKVLTQFISRYYYPTGATDFSVLATKFAYSSMRDIGFSAIREFYPDIAAHYIRKHREKAAAQAARDAAAAGASPAAPTRP